jgi:hypothetical protein
MASRVPRKPRAKKKKLTAKQIARKKRVERAAFRLIAKQEGITQKEARKLYKDGIIEVIFTGPKRKAQRRFIEISPHKFREIPQGKAFKEENAIGPVRSVGYVNKVIKLRRYWNFVRLMADEMGISVQEARKRVKQGVIDIIDLYKFYFTPKEKAS